MSYEDFQRDFAGLSTKLDDALQQFNLQLSPADAYDACQRILDSWLADRSDLHERLPEAITQENNLTYYSQHICILYLEIAVKFFTQGARFSAIALLIHGWNKLAERQQETGYRIYRASIALNLAQFAYFREDIGAAIWWALHTQADDHLGQDWKGGHGYDVLRTALGVSQTALEVFKAIGDNNRSMSQAQNNWKAPNAFAEDVIVRFVLEKRALSYVLGSQSITPEYPISMAYFAALLADVDRKREKQSEKKQKGNALEKLAAYLFLLIPGWLPLRSVQDEKQTAEIDLVVRNLQPNANLMADILGRYFIVECKNWDKPVGSRDVGYFLNKIRQSHASFGVIFSREGITGDGDEEKAAKELTPRAFHEDKSVCIVISRSDLRRLQNGETTFRTLLLELFEEFRFGRPKNVEG